MISPSDYPPEAYARAAGMAPKGRRWAPCPSCGEHSDGTRRGPVRLGKAAWWCNVNGCTGSLPGLVSAFQGGSTSPRGGEYLRAMAAIEGRPVPIAEPIVERSIPPGELRGALLRGCRAADGPPELHAWLRSRSIPPTCAARWVPTPPRWLRRGYPLVIGGYNGTGALKSMHGRAIDGRHPKTAWPTGMSASGLIFMNAPAIEFARGKPEESILICEGATDFMTATGHIPDVPVIGIVSGSVDALRLMEWSGVLAIVATDPDRRGDLYARKIADAVSPGTAKRMPLRRLLA